MKCGREADAIPYDLGGPCRREQQLELAVFLFLIVPTMLLSFVHGGAGRLSFPLLAVAVIVRDLALVALVLFFLWRNGEPFQRIGWSSKNRSRRAAARAAAGAGRSRGRGDDLPRLSAATAEELGPQHGGAGGDQLGRLRPGHGYEGSAGVLTVGAMGAAFSVIYLWRKSLAATITLHFLVDFTGIVLLPALGRG